MIVRKWKVDRARGVGFPASGGAGGHLTGCIIGEAVPGSGRDCLTSQRVSTTTHVETYQAYRPRSFVSVATLVVAGGLGVKASTNNKQDSYRQVEVYSEVLSRIRTEYVEDPNVSAVTNGALHGLLESLDANSSYLRSG